MGCKEYGNSYKLNNHFYQKNKKLDMKGLGPLASTMRMSRSTTELHTLLKFY